MKRTKNIIEAKVYYSWPASIWKRIDFIVLPLIKLTLRQRFIVAYRALFKGHIKIKGDKRIYTRKYLKNIKNSQGK